MQDYTLTHTLSLTTHTEEGKEEEGSRGKELGKGEGGKGKRTRGEREGSRGEERERERMFDSLEYILTLQGSIPSQHISCWDCISIYLGCPPMRQYVLCIQYVFFFFCSTPGIVPSIL